MSDEYQDWKKDEIFELKQEIIRTRKDLEQSEICCAEWGKQALDYKAENIALSGDLERTRKALDVAVGQLKKTHDYIEDFRYQETNYFLVDSKDVSIILDETNEALEQITALEQKEEK